MKLRTKRILILFSIFLNIGFIAAAAHHALFFSQENNGHIIAQREINRLDIPDSQREALINEENNFHQSMQNYHDQRKAFMMQRMLILTAAEQPTTQALDELTEQQLLLTRHKIEEATRFMQHMRDEIGPEKVREFVINMRAHRNKRPR